jgi:hypothetical protein
VAARPRTPKAYGGYGERGGYSGRGGYGGQDDSYDDRGGY